MSALLPRGVPSSPGAYSSFPTITTGTTSSSEDLTTPPQSCHTSLVSNSSLESLSISEDSLTIPLSLFLRDVTIDDAEIVGCGSYGTVLKAKWYGTNVAVKKLHDIFFKSQNTPELSSGILRNLARELNILIQLSHPNIVQFYGVYKAAPEVQFSRELTPDTYIVQELMCCSLSVRNLQRPRLSFKNVVDICLSISSGLQYLHDRHDPIIHRDLATKNILLSREGVAKIGDLGVAKVLNQNLSSTFTRQPGTELYMPPEVKIQGIAYDTKLDIYSFGVIMLEVSIGRGATAREAFEVAQCGSGMIRLVPELERREADFKELGELHPLRGLILECLGKRDTRPSAKMIDQHLLKLTRTTEYIVSLTVPVIVPIADAEVKAPPSSTLDSENEELMEKIKVLEERLQSLLSDNEFLQKKLDAYLKEDLVKESKTRKVSRELDRKESEVAQLMTENALLQVALSEKESEMERLSKVSSPPSSLTESLEVREQRAVLMQRLSILEKRDLESQEMIASLRRENEILRRENGTGRSQNSGVPYHLAGNRPSTTTSHGLPNSQLNLTSGLNSLTSTLTPTLSTLESSTTTTSSSSSSSSDPMTSSSTSMTSSSTPMTSSAPSQSSGFQQRAAPTPAEFKKLKKQLERYKSVNVELDERLKDAKLELQKYQGQQGNTDIMYQMDLQRFIAENSRLQLQLDSAVNEIGRLRSDLINSRRY